MFGLDLQHEIQPHAGCQDCCGYMGGLHPVDDYQLWDVQVRWTQEGRKCGMPGTARFGS